VILSNATFVSLPRRAFDVSTVASMTPSKAFNDTQAAAKVSTADSDASESNVTFNLVDMLPSFLSPSLCVSTSNTSYPVSSMACFRRSGSTLTASKATVALWLGNRVTVAFSTPEIRPRALSIEFTHAAQVIPDIWRTAVAG